MYGADYFILLSRWDSAKGQTGGTASIDLSIDNLIDWDIAHGYLSAWSLILIGQNQDVILVFLTKCSLMS